MAAQASPLSALEFHKLYDGRKPAYEYWFGEAIQKPMPTYLHGALQSVLLILLDRAGWNVFPEVRLKVIREAEPVPDLIAHRGKAEGAYPSTGPTLCVEILSPGDPLRRTLQKATQYLEWGSECVWIIDPERRTALSLSQHNPGEPTWIGPSGVLRIHDTSIELETLFAEVDRRLASVLRLGSATDSRD